MTRVSEGWIEDYDAVKVRHEPSSFTMPCICYGSSTGNFLVAYSGVMLLAIGGDSDITVDFSVSNHKCPI